MKKAASIFSLFCGVSMLAVWAILLAAGKVSELRTSPFEAAFLLGAEFLTAVSLILSGVGLLARKSWGVKANLAALGMLFYCTVYSTGIFGQAGNAPAAGFFAVIAALAGLLSIKFIYASKKGDIL